MMFISEQQDAIVIALLPFLMKPVTLRPRVNRKRKHAEGSKTSGSIEENYKFFTACTKAIYKRNTRVHGRNCSCKYKGSS